MSATTGVLQGSIWGPLLFIINMNDIQNANTKFHRILFADDSNLVSTLCSFNINLKKNFNNSQLSNKINNELENIQIWWEIDILSLNIKKMKFMIFHNNQHEIKGVTNITDKRNQFS